MLPAALIYDTYDIPTASYTVPAKKQTASWYIMPLIMNILPCALSTQKHVASFYTTVAQEHVTSCYTGSRTCYQLLYWLGNNPPAAILAQEHAASCYAGLETWCQLLYSTGLGTILQLLFWLRKMMPAAMQAALLDQEHDVSSNMPPTALLLFCLNCTRKCKQTSEI